MCVFQFHLLLTLLIIKMSDPLADYLEEHGIDDAIAMNVWELGELPFNDIFQDAIAYDDVFRGGHQWVYGHLPYGDGHGTLLLSCPGRLLWKCSWCNFWCDMLDQRVLEEHLIVRCEGIEIGFRERYKECVFNQMYAHINSLSYSMNYVDHERPLRSVSPPASQLLNDE